MGWISALRNPGHITEAVFHFNQTIDLLQRGSSNVEVSRLLFDALNKIQTEWSTHQNSPEIGEVKSFQTMIIEGLEAGYCDEFLRSDELRNFVFFQPHILNHYTLRRNKYRPDVDIESTLARNASKEHHKLVTAYNEFLINSNEQIEHRVIKRTSELLYVIRSNIAHGEKTPYGPDLKKKERDEKVCSVALPLQLLLINLLLDLPDQKLIIYGTLAPDMPNHYIISDLSGNWEKCLINGYIDDVHGLPIFHWDISSPLIETQLFVSTDLPKQWSLIDNFEGSSYKRRLITAKTNTGISVAYIYLTDMV